MSRKLTPPEKSLWQIIARRITPLDPAKAARDMMELMEEQVDNRQKAIQSKKSARIVPPQFPKPLTVNDLGCEVDRRTLQRLQRGQMEIEATIDLHGHSVKQAEEELRSFLRQGQKRQLRCVLVIHGKGSMNGEAKIKRALPEWLSEMPDVVLSHTLAKPQHGGHGASYILLRRKRVTL